MNVATSQRQLSWTPYLRPAPLAAEAALRVLTVGELDAATLALVIGADPGLTAALVRASEPADMDMSIAARIAALTPSRLQSALFPPLANAFAPGGGPFSEADAAAWRVALATAIAAECIAEEFGIAHADAAYLAGLLHTCAGIRASQGDNERRGGALRAVARRYRFPGWLLECLENQGLYADSSGTLAGLGRVLELAKTVAAEIAGAGSAGAATEVARRLRFDTALAGAAHDRAVQSFARRMSLFAFTPATPADVQASLARFSDHTLLYWRVDETRAMALRTRVDHLDALLRFEKTAAGAAPLDDVAHACADGIRAALSADAGLVAAWTGPAGPVTVVRWRAVRGALEPLEIEDSAAGRTAQRFLAGDIWPLADNAAMAPHVLPIHTPARRHVGFVIVAFAGPVDDAGLDHAREWADALGSAIERVCDTARDDAYRDSLRQTIQDLRERPPETAGDGPAIRRRNIARAAMAALHAPLSAVTTQAHRLVSRTTDPETQDLVEALAKDARNAARVMTDLQAIAGGGGAPNEFILINAPLRQFLYAARARLERRSIHLTEHFAEGLPRIRGNARELHHLFTNLFAFIEQRMGHAGRSIAVATAPGADRAAACVTIDAKGMALTQAQAETLFDPFASRDSASTEFALALGACRAIVDECGGTIVARTTDDGVSFTIAFDAVLAVLAVEREPEPEERGAVALAPVAPVRQRDAAEQGERVLIVDDDDTMRDLMKQALLRREYRVETAKDGDEALRALDAGPVDAVLLDLLMPNRDGFAVLRELSRRVGAPPAIVMTGSRSADVREEAMELGAHSFLQKPFELGQLLAEVESLLVHQRR